MTKEQLEEIAMYAAPFKTNEIYQNQKFIGDAYENICATLPTAKTSSRSGI